MMKFRESMKILQTLLLLIFSIQSFAQIGILKGHVSSLEDNSDFGGLTIVLMKDGKEILGTVTDKNGNYEIKKIPIGIYDIKITLLGFRDKVINSFEITEETKAENFVFPDPCKIFEKVCPQGHNDNIIPILYGYPTDRQLRKAKKGKLKLGGCVVTNCDPKWHCTKHNVDF